MQELLDLIPFGSKNAITTSELVNRLRVTNARNAQKLIEEAHADGHVICSLSQPPGGYFRPLTASELRTYIKTVENRAKNSLAALKSAKKMLAEMESTN